MTHTHLGLEIQSFFNVTLAWRVRTLHSFLMTKKKRDIHVFTLTFLFFKFRFLYSILQIFATETKRNWWKLKRQNFHFWAAINFTWPNSVLFFDILRLFAIQLIIKGDMTPQNVLNFVLVCLGMIFSGASFSITTPIYPSEVILGTYFSITIMIIMQIIMMIIISKRIIMLIIMMIMIIMSEHNNGNNNNS